MSDLFGMSGHMVTFNVCRIKMGNGVILYTFNVCRIKVRNWVILYTFNVCRIKVRNGVIMYTFNVCKTKVKHRVIHSICVELRLGIPPFVYNLCYCFDKTSSYQFKKMFTNHALALRILVG